MIKEVDVVIVGAGPAGLSCALELSKHNKKVLLLEKNEVIGPKVCTGCLVKSEMWDCDLPDELIYKKFDTLTLNTPFQKIILNSNKVIALSVDRKNLGQWQLSKLKKTSVKVRTGARVTKIERDYIIINDKEEIKYKYLVGADGSNSIVRKHLAIGEKNIGMAMQYRIPNMKYENMEGFLDSKLFNSWYAWIFPHKDYTIVGCGSDPEILSTHQLKENFIRWINDNKIDVSNAHFEAALINNDYKGLKFGNAFLVGDAAGMASVLTGFGIHQAIISGKVTGQMIAGVKVDTEKLDKILDIDKKHIQLLKFLVKSGPFRNMEFFMLGLLLKNKRMTQKLIDILL